ncbi:S8 family peptidase [Salinibacillus aidingensis]|uniref:S8 family peptidase n=1 Tax=Salinibacillus aidingensis TaxID=237684 RepID=A0ABP3LPG8_9BACI
MKKIFLLPTEFDEIVKEPEKIPYGVKTIDAPQVWGETNGGAGNVVAVIDSGCQVDHPDLRGNIIGGYNFTNDDQGDTSNYYDYAGHGTHVAGTIGAIDNETGVVGVAPNVNLLILKVVDKNGVGSYENLINAIEYATNWRGPMGEKVSAMNISLGGPEDDPNLYSAILKALRKGIITVAAAGNYGDNRATTDEILYPAAYKEVIQVGAVDPNLAIGPFSNSNIEVDFVAPGSNILSTFPISTYARLTGTSMAAPHVTGAVALLYNAFNACDQSKIPGKVFDYLSRHARPLGFRSTLEGNGLVQLS